MSLRGSFYPARDTDDADLYAELRADLDSDLHAEPEQVKRSDTPACDKRRATA